MSDPRPPTPSPATALLGVWWYTYATKLRYWLLTAFVAVVIFVPLLRDALPVTQLGLLPTSAAMAEALNTQVGVVLLPFQLLTLDYKTALALSAMMVPLIIGAIAGRLWKAHGWWVAALMLLSPFLISTIYQRGDIALLVQWFYPLILTVFLLTLRTSDDRLRYLYPVMWGIFSIAALLAIAARQQGALDPYQLLLAIWAEPTQWREWVGAPSFQIGVVPITLGVLTLLAALPRRHEKVAQVALGLLGIALLATLLTLLPSPILLWVMIAVSTLILAIGALPVLDSRYASLPVQIGIVAIALLTVYPYLQPAWFEDVEGTPTEQVFGEELLWLARSNVTRTDDRIIVETWWQALQPIPQDYSVFVHFVDAQGEVVAQADALLADGDALPTSQWAQGYVVYQKYESPVTVPLQEIRVGVYDVATLQRLPKFTPYNTSLIPTPTDYYSFTELP